MFIRLISFVYKMYQWNLKSGIKFLLVNFVPFIKFEDLVWLQRVPQHYVIFLICGFNTRLLSRIRLKYFTQSVFLTIVYNKFIYDTFNY